MSQTNFKYHGVILSAGESSRMGFPKALLDSGDGTGFLEKIIANYRGVTPSPVEIIVALGSHRDRIREEIDLSKCRVVINEKPELGQLSSLVVVLKTIIAAASEGILLSLVDHPLVVRETYQKIVDFARENPGSIVLPRFNGRKGHPVFFPREIFQDLLDSPLEQGARYAVRKNSDRIKVLDVNDPGILKDIDTKSQYIQNIKKSI